MGLKPDHHVPPIPEIGGGAVEKVPFQIAAKRSAATCAVVERSDHHCGDGLVFLTNNRLI